MREVATWDFYHMSAAKSIASRSKDPSSQVGCVLVDPKSHHHLVSGYNGFVPGVEETPAKWERPEKYDHVVHAEANAVGWAARKGIGVDGAVAYVTALPCLPCMKLLLTAGISAVYYNTLLHGWDEDHRKSLKEAQDKGILVEQFPPVVNMEIFE